MKTIRVDIKNREDHVGANRVRGPARGPGMTELTRQGGGGLRKKK